MSSAAMELEFFSVEAGVRSRFERVERHAPSRGGNGIGDGRGLRTSFETIACSLRPLPMSGTFIFNMIPLMYERPEPAFL